MTSATPRGSASDPAAGAIPRPRCQTPAAVAALVVALGLALGAAPGADETIIVRRCALDFERTTAVGAASRGILKERLVEPGERVERGQVLGRLRDDEARIEVELRRSESENDVEIRLGRARLDRAVRGLKTTLALNRRGAASAEESALRKLEVDVATLELEQAENRRRLARLRLGQAEAVARALEFTSPHAGVVVAALKRPGEAVALDEPVFRIVDTDDILVTGELDVSEAWRVREGRTVRVVAEVAGAVLSVEDQSFEGVILFVDRHVDPQTRTCKVVARIKNREGMLRSGLEARLEILPRPSDAVADRRPPGAVTAPGVATAPQPSARAHTGARPVAPVARLPLKR